MSHPTPEERIRTANAAERVADLLDRTGCRNLGELIRRYPDARTLADVEALAKAGGADAGNLTQP